MPLTPELLTSLNLSDEAREVLQRNMAEEQRTATELAEFRKDKKESGTRERLTKLSTIFGEGATGLLSVFSNLLMADDGDVAVTLLSDTGQKDHLTITNAIDRIIAALPTDDKGAIELAQKTNLLENPLSGRPDLKPDPKEVGDKAKELTGDQLLAQWQEHLPGGVDLSIASTPATPAPAAQ